jgi:hypothetical protein
MAEGIAARWMGVGVLKRGCQACLGKGEQEEYQHDVST